ncbi:Rieske 2Fe-2S domain-containing protein [Flavobacterium sp. F-65]|uniref:Rieske 2Fe-2S domain-containing protein n=1 Tax=Flavobacterium pisciphilum TaxID=2893755 RepID=A0ABS8MYT1_9FLAO|nr:SRPBCC family protein [Flavobacterium sp. F-65]MCC9073924.1 Rieske 2Fe-2S domain-containing protein [Flavobacterium sp. F-65]
MTKNLNYIDETVYQDEKSLFFNESWILVAHKNELLNTNDFVTFEYFGNKIFIQNFNGTIKSFQNVCLHRFNTIHEEPCGNRVSSCLYHNWTYGKKGNVIGLMCRNSFEKDDISGLKLKEYEVGNCGDFFFIKLNDKLEQNLEQYLGSIFNPLEEISRHFGVKTIDYTIEHKVNWKLLVENVLECYHCTSVHENSFAKMGFGSVAPEKFDFYDAHSWCEFPKSEDVKQNKIIEKALASRTFKTQGYLHFYIYPNAFISSVEGKGFYFGFMLPESPSKTNLRVRYFSPKFDKDLSESEMNIIDFINNSSNESLDLVLNEDKKIAENIQSNLVNFKDSSPIFGDEEFRILKFYEYFNAQKELKNI